MVQIETKHRRTFVAGSVAAFYLLVYFAVLPTRFWSDSEIWGLRQATACTGDWASFACSWKPLFNFTLGNFIRAFDFDRLASMMTAARLFALLPAWLMVAGIWLYSRRSLEALVILFASSLFLVDASVARTDLVALPWLVLHAALLLQPPARWSDRAVNVGIFSSLIIGVLMTPKMVLLYACFLPLLWQRFQKQRLFAIAAIGVGALVFVSFTDVHATFRFFLLSFSASDFGSEYFSLNRLQFLTRAATENPALSIVVIVAFLLAAIKAVRVRDRQAAAAVAIFVLILLFPDRLPYFLCTSLFLFVFVSAPLLDERRWSRVVVSACAVLAVVFGVHWASLARAMSNSKQREMVDRLHELVANYPDARIIDSLGLLVDRPLVPIFLGPGDLQERNHVSKRLMEENFEIIIETNKLFFAEGTLANLLPYGYIEASKGIFVRTADIDVLESDRSAAAAKAAVLANFVGDLGPETPIAIFSLSADEDRWILERILPLSVLDSLGNVCTGACKTLRVTPYSNFLSHAFPGDFWEEFRFESLTPRLPRWL